MKGKLMFAVLCALALLLPFGCSDDCSTCPTCPQVDPNTNALYTGRLYVTMSAGNTGLYVFDLPEEKLIDSVMYPYPMTRVDVSPDGKYVAVEGYNETLVYDARTLEAVSYLPSIYDPTFINDGQELLGSHGGTIYVYHVPGFNLLWSEELPGSGNHVFCDQKNLLFGIAEPDTIFCYSFTTHSIQNIWRAPHTQTDYLLRKITVNETGTMCYGLSSGYRGLGYDGELTVLNLETGTLVRQIPFLTGLGGMAVRPGDDEVYVSDPGDTLGYPYHLFSPGTIFVYGAQTGDYLKGVSLWGYYDNIPQAGMDAREIAITPDGNQLFIQSGHIKRRPGTVARIDTKAKKIESLLFPDIDRYPWGLAVGPKP